jgi:hopene-associated glycosyltransferase HpnB
MTVFTIIITALAALALIGWLYLLLFRRRFWLANQRLRRKVRELDDWPPVAAIVPARDEAAVVDRAIRSLLDQDYPGQLAVLLVDDYSTDGTAAAARRVARETERAEAFHVIPARALPPGWTGKLSAMATGFEALLKGSEESGVHARYVLFTDADIVHAPQNLKRLVAKAETKKLDLVSLMVRLHCERPIERLLIPAFVFFFQKLYPFPAANSRRSHVAAAAGGCMLVRRRALERAGGLERISSELIDDCALAALLKPHGPIWIGLATDGTRSIRPYDGLKDIWAMVARTAYSQLDYSPLMLLATVLGMSVLYLVPIVALVWGLVIVAPLLAALGLAPLLLMWIAYLPTWRLYRRIGWAFFALPAAAVLYTLMTIDSAWRHLRGRGGGWKNRTYARRRDAHTKGAAQQSAAE